MKNREKMVPCRRALRGYDSRWMGGEPILNWLIQYDHDLYGKESFYVW